MSIIIRKADRRDAADLCILIDMAGDGMPTQLWRDFRELSSPLEHARNRARREEGGFSYKNADIAEVEGDIAGMAITYEIAADPVEEEDYSDYPSYIRPLAELEAKSPHALYINVLSVYAENRKKGIGLKLLEHAEQKAQAMSLKAVSYITTDSNSAMLTLGEKHGYKRVEQRSMVTYDETYPPGDNWVLLVKEL